LVLATMIVRMRAGREGLAAARARGQQPGRPPALTPEKVAYALRLLEEPAGTTPTG
jgi:hypothetical protein